VLGDGGQGAEKERGGGEVGGGRMEREKNVEVGREGGREGWVGKEESEKRSKTDAEQTIGEGGEDRLVKEGRRRRGDRKEEGKGEEFSLRVYRYNLGFRGLNDISLSGDGYESTTSILLGSSRRPMRAFIWGTGEKSPQHGLWVLSGQGEKGEGQKRAYRKGGNYGSSQRVRKNRYGREIVVRMRAKMGRRRQPGPAPAKVRADSVAQV